MKSKDGEHEANVIIANHSSWFDIYLLMTTAEALPGFVSKVSGKLNTSQNTDFNNNSLKSFNLG
jgi:hypothetical protein